MRFSNVRTIFNVSAPAGGRCKPHADSKTHMINTVFHKWIFFQIYKRPFQGMKVSNLLSRKYTKKYVLLNETNKNNGIS